MKRYLSDIWQNVSSSAIKIFDKRFRLCQNQSQYGIYPKLCSNKAIWMIPSCLETGKNYYTCTSCKDELDARAYGAAYNWKPIDDLMERPIICCTHCGEPHMSEDECEEV